jgi:hypothetical protein
VNAVLAHFFHLLIKKSSPPLKQSDTLIPNLEQPCPHLSKKQAFPIHMNLLIQPLALLGQWGFHFFKAKQLPGHTPFRLFN